MKKIMRSFIVAGFALAAAGCALAQAPAGAPAGAMGICKDGTYSMQAKKEGACRGHKGVQTWYAAAPAPASAPAPPPQPAAAPAMPAPSPGLRAPSRPAPTPDAQPAPSMPAPTPATPATSTGKRLSPAQAAEAKTAVPGGGPGLVWVNTSSNVYHCNGDPFYGKTKAGKYMSEADAKAAGAHGERGKVCTGK